MIRLRSKTGKQMVCILSCILMLQGCGSAKKSKDTSAQEGGKTETVQTTDAPDDTAGSQTANDDKTDAGAQSADGDKTDGGGQTAGGDTTGGNGQSADGNKTDDGAGAGDIASADQTPSGPKLGENIFADPNFADGGAVWAKGQGASQVSSATADAAIADGIMTYGVITRDLSYSAATDCFAQDITASVKQGEEYQFEFYAMLSDAYVGAPADQRKVEFAPYVTAGGNTAYLGTYSSEIGGRSSMSLEPGVWTKYEGTFKIPKNGEPEEVVIRIIEQGTNYGQGDCVKGDYYITGLSMRKIIRENVGIEEDIPNLKDYVASESGLGSDAIMGAGVTYGEIDDEYVYQLVTKHFNAVTFGNELKPDSMFGYSNNRCPGIAEVEFKGQKRKMPVINFSNADRMCDIIMAWNKDHPSDQIRVRGHVLVWHAQTPEWFFHEDFDASKDYVSKEEMDIRLEWYIKSMMEHYTGKDSKYQGLFYGWDVVNEAVSNGSGYRTDAENPNESLTKSTHDYNSSWWHIYQSNEYIINAFKYANKYAPASLELYYNDYGECSTGKMAGISALLRAVKEQEGAPGTGTRISAFGMQAHYDSTSPAREMLIVAVRTYCGIVGKVQLTEVDIKASNRYDGTEKTKDYEYTRMAYQYKTIYETLKELDKEDGVDISGFTFWGVVDKYSWLQSSSDLGGGADGLRSQCPLPFDGNYKAKPVFWAFVDPDKIPPYR